MIPKVIHCFWAEGPKTKLAEKCLASWRRFAPGWEIREWSLERLGVGEGLEEGRDEEAPPFLKGAVKAKKWAMVSDWARMWALQREGGVYLDLDVELVAPIETLPEGEWVAGEWTAKGDVWMNPGSGIALAKESPVAAGLLKRYAQLPFDPKREMMVWINAQLRELAARYGLPVLEPEAMSPIGIDGKMHRTERTVGIHWYAMSWASPKRKVLQWLSWHGMRPVVDFLVRVKRLLKEGAGP